MSLPDPVSPGSDGSPAQEETGCGPPRPLQFRLRSVLVITAAIAILFGVLRWLGVPPQANLIVLVVLTISMAAAVGLVAVIASSLTRPRD